MCAQYPHNQFCLRLKCPDLLGSLVWALGLILLNFLYRRPLQWHFHSLGLTNRFTPPYHSDPLVLTSLLRQWQDLSFLTSEITIWPFQTIFMDASTQGWGGHMCIPRFQDLDPFRWPVPHQHFGAQGRNFGLALHHWVSVLRGHQVMIATDNTAVVSYISKQGQRGTHSRSLLHLVVDLFLWLQTQDIAIWADTFLAV